MKNKSWQIVSLAGALIAGPLATTAQSPPHPTIVIYGKSWTPASVVARNMGSPEEQTTPMTPYKIIDNIYYVGSLTLSTYLITTPAGNILMDTTYERNVRNIEKSVEQLGFKFSDTKYIVGNHWHNDHMEGDALAKELTGAQVWVMAEDVPQLKNVKPGGKEHPVDRELKDGDTLSLGGTVLTAHLTAGHTHGCTTWTMKAKEGGKTYDVVFHCSLRIGAADASKPIPEILVTEFNRTIPIVRALPCDVPLGDHPSQYDMPQKFARLGKSQTNPFIDPAGCNIETDIEEMMFKAVLKEQHDQGLR